MMSGSILKTRRDFILELAAASSACFIDIPSLLAAEKPSMSYSRVCIVKDDSVRLENGSLSENVINTMLSKTMQKLTGKNNDTDAWKQLFSADDTVGIKLNCLAGRGLSSNPELVNAIVRSLNTIGIRNENIILWDRTDSDLTRAGFTLNKSKPGPFCFGTNGQYDYDLGIVNSLSIGSLFSPILTKLCSAIISVPVVKDHDLAGISGTMKNFFGAIHNPNKYHDNNCNPYVADLMAVPFLKNKLRLTICDAFNVQYHGGPALKQKWCWAYNGILASTDFVAVDAFCYQLIDEKRRQKDMKSLKESGREPSYISTASKNNFGRSNPEEIEVIQL